MSINISAFAGAGAQFFDANGEPLSGGLIYSYLAGTTTVATTFTSRAGTSNNTNPIVLDAAGRTPAEIWLTGGSLYKFILKSSVGVQIGSYDNIPAIGDVTSINTLITVAGTNTLTGLATPTLPSYVAGAQYSFIAQNTNTAAVTIDIDTLGAKSITKAGTVALEAGDIVAGALYQINYDGTRFQLMTRTSASQLVVGTTAQRPSSPTSGMIRLNSTTGNPEWYDSVFSQWLRFNQSAGYTASYLVVAGGGGGGYGDAGGGGGGGGALASTLTLSSGTLYSVVVGAGGAASAISTATGTSGSSSVLGGTITALGGGGGGSSNNATVRVGSNGGSGGGGAGGSIAATYAGGSGTSGQGYAGGSGSSDNVTFTSGGGGGGASAVGANGVTGGAGATGGAGLSSSITGSAVTYGGGGGAVTDLAPRTNGSGGAGGGGAGSYAGTAGSGTANTGGGGGSSGTGTAGSGGSGVVILSVPTTSYTGTTTGSPTITTSGANTIMTFAASGSYLA